MIRIDKRQLGQLDPISEGGMGKVYRVSGTVANVPGRLVFKEPLAGLDPAVSQQMMESMRYAVSLRDRMPAADLAELDALTTWPLAMVEERNRDVGIVMRILDDDFFIQARTSRRVFEFQLLGASDDQVKAIGIDRSAADDDLVRLALMARLAYAIEVIHRPRGQDRFVYGDLNLRNAAVATDPPRILLMDCDGVVALNDPPRAQPNTAFFIPPEITGQQQSRQDQVTDVFKLGLCVIRGLAIGRGVSQLTDPTHSSMIPGLLDRAGVGLLQRAVGADRARRPTAEEIKDYLVGRVLSLAQPAELRSATLNHTVTVRGSDTLVTWTHRYGHRIRIHGVNGFDIRDIDPDAHPHGYAIRPPTAGPIFVEVSNKHGSDEMLAGYLDYFEVPTLDIAEQLRGRLPRLAMVELPQVEVPDVFGAGAPSPVLPVDAFAMPHIDLPPMQLPSVAPLISLGHLVPDVPLGRAGPRAAIEQAQREVGERLSAAVGDAIRDGLPSISQRIHDELRRVADETGIDP